MWDYVSDHFVSIKNCFYHEIFPTYYQDIYTVWSTFSYEPCVILKVCCMCNILHLANSFVRPLTIEYEYRNRWLVPSSTSYTLKWWYLLCLKLWFDIIYTMYVPTCHCMLSTCNLSIFSLWKLMTLFPSVERVVSVVIYPYCKQIKLKNTLILSNKSVNSDGKLHHSWCWFSALKLLDLFWLLIGRAVVCVSIAQRLFYQRWSCTDLI